MSLTEVKPKHESAVIRAMLDEIEAALARGLTREQIHEVICAQHGLSIGFNGFLSAIARARKARGKANPHGTATQPLTATSQPATDTDKVDQATQVPTTPTAGIPKALAALTATKPVSAGQAERKETPKEVAIRLRRENTNPDF
ncbi:hypothetical protein [Paraburkholderia sp. GAS32]|uniref:hypothetical protein n=1 Tax=Paraburkholderia sp. GAS32 TaxID=3035129 RepID=UPI003D1F5867